MIRLATLKDLPEILRIKDAAIKQMHINNIDQWDDSYPTAHIFEDDIIRKELYVIDEGTKLVGFACINDHKAPEHGQLAWKTPNNAYMVHRLAVDPAANGNGYASKILRFAEELASSKNVTSMRINTFCKNTIAQQLFKKNGYEYVGDLIFPRKEEPFVAFEKFI